MYATTPALILIFARNLQIYEFKPILYEFKSKGVSFKQRAVNIKMNQSIVIDNGTGMIKAGFAGADKPRAIYRSYVGRIKHKRSMPGGALEGNDTFVGSKAEEHRGALILTYATE